MQLSDKVVLVTGASSGIGKATAILFASHGARLALVGRNVDNLRAAASACARDDQQPLVIVADLATDEGCERVAKETLEHYGRLDVLVNNAAVSTVSNIETIDMATFDRVFNTNVRGVFNLTRLLAPALITAKGNIINVSSVSAKKVGTNTVSPYGMSKAALDQFTRQIACELAPKGVRVNAVSPGYTDTGIYQRKSGCSDAEYKAWMQSSATKIPMGRFCQSEDVAKMIVFVAGEDCGMVTGTVIRVDGGYAA